MVDGAVWHCIESAGRNASDSSQCVSSMTSCCCKQVSSSVCEMNIVNFRKIIPFDTCIVHNMEKRYNVAYEIRVPRAPMSVCVCLWTHSRQCAFATKMENIKAKKKKKKRERKKKYRQTSHMHAACSRRHLSHSPPAWIMNNIFWVFLVNGLTPKLGFYDSFFHSSPYTHALHYCTKIISNTISSHPKICWRNILYVQANWSRLRWVTKLSAYAIVYSSTTLMTMPNVLIIDFHFDGIIIGFVFLFIIDTSPYECVRCRLVVAKQCTQRSLKKLKSLFCCHWWGWPLTIVKL